MVTRRRLLKAAALASLLPRRLKAQDRPLIVIGSNGWLYPGWEWTADLDPGQVELTTDLVSYAGETLADRGVTLLAFVVPSRARLYPDFLPAWAGVDQVFLSRYQRIVDHLLGGGVAAFDTMGLMQELQARRMQVLHPTDQHWTLCASEASGRHVAELLLETFNLPPSDRGGVRLGDVRTETRQGDLVSLLPSGLREHYPAEDFRVRDFSAPGGLLDESPVADVTVVGDSAVKPELGFSASMSAELDRPVDLFSRQGNVGPWVTLLDYLGSDRFQAHPPRFLLLEMHEYYFESPPDRTGWWDNNSIMTAGEWRTRLRSALVG